VIHVVGHTAFDHICRVPVFPEKNASIQILDRWLFFGGGAANIAAGIATLGEASTLVSAVGADFSGSEYDHWMNRLGIVQQFFVVEDACTPAAYIFTDEAGDQETFFDWGASRVFSREEAPQLPFVHMATADPDFNVRVAAKADFCTFDPGQDVHRYSKAQFEAILDHIGILFANKHEVIEMCRIMSVSREDIVRMVPVVVFTEGKHGSRLYVQGEDHLIPAVPITQADPTGAGDAYRAGFLSAYAKGHTPLECCRIGSITASFVVEKAGCQTNLPSWDRMKERYRDFFGYEVPPSGGKRFP
jgi:sugar/nucleoside kinase (ribokinase family)